jgi:RNA polymerase sigma-70 factor (ECF subfamily)
MIIDETHLKGWMLAGLDGDAASHSALLRALVPILRAFYRRRLRGSDDDIEDLVQETLIAVHERRGTFDRDRQVSAWLFAIARYKLVDHFRRSGRTVPLDDEEAFAVAGNAEASLACIDVERLLDTLPAKQSRSIRATKIEGLSIAEAASAAGIGESDVKVSVHRGLKALAAHVRKLGR